MEAVKAKLFFKKYIEPFVAVGIFIMLIVVANALLKEQTLKREISENCGWGEEDYKCYCEKSKAMEIENMLNGEIELDNVQLAG